ncbi:DUF2808 domain-containing protein [Synechococcus sp. RSCCF101]|uniref:DUF2808 domain-containing protein n=1 Tax=Synechococcus sp. RSCCF101 TaxID=2511069 RepID=UPI001245BE41|nr:DUF2808 domain-containing protein [Synechococcus sp. RSCCF101]QEY31315.1 DUF2808 domain-containing protein [Synechococcus sp. RSCCF101]
MACGRTLLLSHLAALLSIGTVPVLSLLAPPPVAPPARAIELRGQTFFLEPPTKVRLRNYRWQRGAGGAEVFITLDLPTGAGVSLGGLTVQQIRGVEAALEGGIRRAHAFIGRPRARGAELPVSVEASEDARLVAVRFPEPVPPGTQVTVAFPIGINPAADLYMFTVAALPAGPGPVSQPVGVVRMSVFTPW